MKKTYLSALILAAITVPAMADTTIDEMFSQGTLNAQLRMFDFTRDYDGTTNTKHDTSLGGLFNYRTAAVNGITLGTTFASANHVFNGDSDDVYGLVAKGSDGGHESVNRMQEYYIEGNWWNTLFRYGAQQIRTPMMNPHDIRAIPRTFRGLSAINNSFDNLTLQAYYITDSMGWSDSNFISVKEAVQNELRRAGVNADVADEPVIAVGASYNVPLQSMKMKADLWHYRMKDVFDQTYAKVNMSVKAGNSELYFTPSYLDQQSTGDQTAGSLDTYQYGFHLGAKMAGFDATLMYAKTGDDALLAPWGDEKVVIQQVYQCTRANEKVYAGRLAYDFTQVGVEGLQAYVFYGKYEVPEGQASDFTETDFSVTYALDKVMKGLSTRVRYAIVDFDNGEDLNDLRLYLTYKFKLGH